MSGQMSDSMRNNALIGLLIAFACIFIYLAIRFEATYAIERDHLRFARRLYLARPDRDSPLFWRSDPDRSEYRGRSHDDRRLFSQ